MGTEDHYESFPHAASKSAVVLSVRSRSAPSFSAKGTAVTLNIAVTALGRPGSQHHSSFVRGVFCILQAKSYTGTRIAWPVVEYW